VDRFEATNSEHHVPLGDMQNLRLCVECAREEPGQLEVTVPFAPSPLVLEGAAAAAQAKLPPLAAGLTSFMLIPKTPQGESMIKDKAELFDHVVRYTRRTATETVALRPGNYLNVEMSEDQARIILNPTQRDYGLGAIMRSAGGSGGSISLPKRKLDAMAGIRGQSGIMNDKEHIRKMRAQLDLAQSLAAVKHAEVEAKRVKKDAAEAELFDSAPGAVAKLRSKGGDVSKLFKAEMCAIALRYFATALNATLKAADLESALQALITAKPAVLPAVVVEAGPPTNAAAL